jgi:phospholipid/cholesterol/gamma-HCH transport system substrate-binding protein
VPGTIRPPRQRLGADEVLTGAVSKDPFEVFATLEPKLGSTLSSLELASDAVSKLAANVDRILLGEDDSFERMVRKTDAALESFSLAMTNINDVLGDPQARARLKETLTALPEVLTDLRTTVKGMGATVETADRNLRNLEGLTKPLGERGAGMVAQVDRTIGRLDETLGQAAQFTRALNESQGTLGKLVRDPKVYDDLSQAAANVNRLTRELRPIVDDVRVFTDKIARHPEQLGVRGALDRRAGLK